MPSLLTTISALADDMSAIAIKIGATSMDDIASQTARTLPKAAGLLVDDAAVIPQFVDGAVAKRELPIIWSIAKGSLKNKFLMIPLIILATIFAPIIITPILLLGAAFLAFEGVEGLGEKLGFIKPHHQLDTPIEKKSEPKMISDAIKTDTVLSVEILVITIAEIMGSSVIEQFMVLIVVGLIATIGVYGAVAMIIKMDDVGFFLQNKYHDKSFMHTLGSKLVSTMPKVMNFLAWVGGVAMLTVSGGIIVHAFHAVPEITVAYLSTPIAFLENIPYLIPTLSFLSPAIPAIFLGVFIYLLHKLYKKIFNHL